MAEKKKKNIIWACPTVVAVASGLRNKTILLGYELMVLRTQRILSFIQCTIYFSGNYPSYLHDATLQGTFRIFTHDKGPSLFSQQNSTHNRSPTKHLHLTKLITSQPMENPLSTRSKRKLTSKLVSLEMYSRGS